jgi:hypothetical protein
MPEWLNGTVSKTVVGFSLPRVRIPVSPPISLLNNGLGKQFTIFLRYNTSKRQKFTLSFLYLVFHSHHNHNLRLPPVFFNFHSHLYNLPFLALHIIKRRSITFNNDHSKSIIRIFPSPVDKASTSS